LNKVAQPLPVINKVKELQADGLQTASFHRLAYLPCQRFLAPTLLGFVSLKRGA
jgi:hypothetical protein